MQDILTYIIILSAIVFTIYKTVRTIFYSKKQSGCSGGCSNCASATQLPISSKAKKKIDLKSLKMGQ